MHAAILSNNRLVAPFGLNGGEPGQPGRNRVIRAGGSVEEYDGILATEMHAGDTLVIATPGGARLWTARRKMTWEIALVLGILAIALVLFITEILRMDVVALLVLGVLALTGLVDSTEALSGFSNPAVITVWAMFILSAGLTRTGIADVLGRQVLRLAGKSEVTLIVVIMLTAGGLSAFMNNIGVAALMLPVVVDIARRTEIAASRLLMPLAYGSLLGGLTTMIGTPPNLLISGALRDAGETSFSLFDFAPVGIGALVVGTLFVALWGRRILPFRTSGVGKKRSQRNLRAMYGLQERTFMMRIPNNAILVGKSLAASRIGSAVGLIVIALDRQGKIEALPSRKTILAAGDKLLVQGRLDRFEELRRWSEVVIEREAPLLKTLANERVSLVEARIADDSALIKRLVNHSDFRRRFGVNVLAIRRNKPRAPGQHFQSTVACRRLVVTPGQQGIAWQAGPFA